MAVQVSYPGVYIDEFSPGAPIEGVGTNTAVFLGLAETGPINTPTLITSWDAFKAVFGGFLADAGAWLAQGVYGFFLNGGTRCYVVRVSSAQQGTASLATRKTGTALVATARAEGPAGNGIAIAVADSSRSAQAVAGYLTRAITKVEADRKTLTVSGGVTGFAAGVKVGIAKGTTTDLTGLDVASVTAPGTVELANPLPQDADVVGGSVTVEFAVRLLVLTGKASAVGADGATVTLAAAHRFAPGDLVTASKGADTATVTVTGVNGQDLAVSPALATTFAGADLRTADLPAGARRARLLVPDGFSINAAFPAGSLVRVGTRFHAVSAAGGDTLQFDAPGLPATALSTQAAAPEVATAEFSLTVHSPLDGTTEVYDLLSFDPRTPGFWERVDSPTVVFSLPDAVGAPADDGDNRPLAQTVATAGGVADDRAQSWADLTTRAADFLHPLGKLRDVSLVAIPGGTEPAVQQALIAHCEALYDRFAVLDSPPALDQSEVAGHFANVRSEKGFAALYYPWIQVLDPVSGKPVFWPPSGHLTGVYARTDASRGVHKAPANTTIAGALGVAASLSDSEQGPLNLLGVNVLRTLPGQSQPVVWGARTTAGDLNRNWQYVNIRRLFIFAEQSIERGIRWAIFEPNDLALWQKLKRSISDFLTSLWRDGALFGAKPAEAFYVRIDEDLNPPSSRALGRLYIEVGLVPTYPAEFIVLRIGIWDGGSDVTTN